MKHNYRRCPRQTVCVYPIARKTRNSISKCTCVWLYSWLRGWGTGERRMDCSSTKNEPSSDSMHFFDKWSVLCCRSLLGLHWSKKRMNSFPSLECVVCTRRIDQYLFIISSSSNSIGINSGSNCCPKTVIIRMAGWDRILSQMSINYLCLSA